MWQDVDQRLTRDVERLCDDLAALIPSMVKPVVDIAWFSVQLYQLTGRRGMSILYLYAFLGFGALSVFTPDFGALAKNVSLLLPTNTSYSNDMPIICADSTLLMLRSAMNARIAARPAVGRRKLCRLPMPGMSALCAKEDQFAKCVVLVAMQASHAGILSGGRLPQRAHAAAHARGEHRVLRRGCPRGQVHRRHL